MIKEYRSFLSALHSILEVSISIPLGLSDDAIGRGLTPCLVSIAFVESIFDVVGCFWVIGYLHLFWLLGFFY